MLLYMKNWDTQQLKALLKLIETESDEYTDMLRPELAAAIKSDPARVQQAMDSAFSSSVPPKVRYTLEEICWGNLAEQVSAFAGKINPDLEEGLWILAMFASPSAKRVEITQKLDKIAHDLRPILLNAKNLQEIATLMGKYFFSTLHFVTLPANLDIKDISFGRFLIKKRGSSLCSACLYQTIAQRFGVESGLVDLAGRILVFMQDPDHDQILLIDPLDNGKILTKQDCKDYIIAREIKWNDEFLSPLSSRTIIRRFIANMIYVLNKLRDERRLKYLRNYLEIIKN